MKLLRWKAVVPLGILLGLLVAGWLLALDTLVRRGVEQVGTYVVGARVDVASADVRLAEGSVTLRGLQVTNPDAPMTNLVEAREIVADLRLTPLLERKVVVETVAVRGVRFGTPRARSGAINDPNPASGRIRREISEWAGGIAVPSFSLEGLGAAVNVDAIDSDSLRTLAEARATVAFADSLRTMWRQELAALNPGPQIDSLRALAERARAANPLRLGITGVARLVSSARSTLDGAATLRARLTALESTARSGLSSLQSGMQDVLAAQEIDYGYARRLLKLPSLDAPNISPALFAQPAIEWLRPVLYWIRLAEQYLPPGLDPRRHPGPDRSRRAGTTVLYTGKESYPRFLLEHGEVDLELGGTGVQAGRYVARISGLTSQPALYGGPLEVAAGRSGAARGPSDLRMAAVLNHTTEPVRDSLELALRGISLPTLELPPVNARLVLGRGSTDLTLHRVGDDLSGRWVWRSANVSWERLPQGGRGNGEGGNVSPNRRTADPPGGAAVGSRQWAEDFLWRVVSSMREVEIDIRIGGALAQPSLSVRSNVGNAVARSLRRELGREVQRAERQVRAEVDRLVQQEVAAVRAKVAAVETALGTEIAVPLSEVTRLEAQLQEELRKLARGRIRIP